jgi:antitoxin YobK
MDFDSIQKLIEENKEIVDFGKFGQGVSDELLEKAQVRLGVKFPPSYIWWLKNYFGGSINGEEIFSIYETNSDPGIIPAGDVVYINELNRKDGFSTPEQLVIQENDQGESYYFDLTDVNEEGECPIYVDATESKYADDFLHFISQKIKE